MLKNSMSDAPTPDQLTARLTTFLADQSGAAVTITHAAPLAGGASRDMWRIEATFDGQTQMMVLRRDLPTSMTDTALTRAHEFQVMERAYQSGVRVARPRYLCEDASVLGGAFFLMDYVEGIAIGRKVVQMPDLAAARAALPGQMADQLARIHALNANEFPFLPRTPDGISPARNGINQARATLDALDVCNPAFEFALQWAEAHTPVTARQTFVHGDFRIGNLMVDAHGLTAVADWEFCHVGDPDEELGYLCMRDWRFGVGQLRVGGISDREPFLSAYEAASGRSVDRTAVDFWELLGNIRWGVICLAQANRHLSGRDPSVELASLGRRSADMQIEMLRMIDTMGV